MRRTGQRHYSLPRDSLHRSERIIYHHRPLGTNALVNSKLASCTLRYRSLSRDTEGLVKTHFHSPSCNGGAPKPYSTTDFRCYLIPLHGTLHTEIVRLQSSLQILSVADSFSIVDSEKLSASALQRRPVLPCGRPGDVFSFSHQRCRYYW